MEYHRAYFRDLIGGHVSPRILGFRVTVTGIVTVLFAVKHAEVSSCSPRARVCPEELGDGVLGGVPHRRYPAGTAAARGCASGRRTTVGLAAR